VLWLVSTACGIDTGALIGGSLLRPVQFVLTWIVLLFATRLAFRLALRLDMFARRILVVGRPADAARTRAAIERMRAGFFTLAGTAAPADAGALSPAALAQRRIWAVVVTEEARGALPQEELMRGKHAGIHVFSDVEFREQQLRRIDLAHLAPDWMIFAPGLSRGPVEAAIRRGFDMALSLGMLIFTLPLMALTAVLIRLDSAGPILYRQERVGLQGRVFTLLKFRSMRTDAEAGGPAWAAQRDSRVTRIGGFLRRSRIDELPQLINVLKGEMSFVGPRPERPHFVAQLAAEIPFYDDRAAVKPGITGWAQVNYPYGASIEDARQKLSYDLYYIKRRSLFLDFLILVATVRVILFQEGSR
jgi:sugar transferase (PEP-CTERM system associated)